MNLIQRLFKRPQQRPGRNHMMALARQFQAAQRDRNNYNWNVSNSGINQDIYAAGETLRTMGRWLVQNTAYGKRFMQMLSTNVVGAKGFTLTMDIRDANNKADKLANKAIEKAFYDWTRKGICEITGGLSLWELCRLIAKAVPRDGEVLVQKIRGKAAGNKYNYSLRVLDISRLDTRLNGVTKGGNEIIMGVEMNADGRPVAYHLFDRNPNDHITYNTMSTGQHIRVEAYSLDHIFKRHWLEQVRGVTEMHAAIADVKNLSQFEDFALMAARIGASKMGFYKTKDGNADGIADGKDENTGEYFESAEGGIFSVMPADTEFQTFDPAYPHDMFDGFAKAFKRKIASALGVAYNNFANDLEGVNFSSIRSGTLEERDNWMEWQEFIIENLLNSVFEEWLEMALLSGAIVLPNGSPLPSSKLDKFKQYFWRGRRWMWVDPRSDATAAKIEVLELRTKSRTQVAADAGRDIEEVFTELQQEQEQAKEKGIDLAPLKNTDTIAANDGGDDSATGETDETAA